MVDLNRRIERFGTDNWLLDNNETVHNWIKAGVTITGPSKASITTDWKMNNARNLNSGQTQATNLGTDGKSSGLSQELYITNKQPIKINGDLYDDYRVN